MTAKDLKNALLQEAIQGKLVPQIASEGNARDLLEEIRKEKLSHGLDFANAKSGKRKSKKETALAGSNPCDITEEEIPFEIPENWCWCRLGEICNEIKRGKSPKYADKSNFLAFAQKCNVKTGGIDLGLALYLDENSITRYSETDNLVQGDIVINSTGGGTMGRVGLYETQVPAGIKGVYPDSHVTVIRSIGNINQHYLYYVLKLNQPVLEKCGTGSTNQTELKPAVLADFVIPLPPLAEQKRIVAAIEKFMPLIEEYGKKETQLKAINEKIGTLTKKAILQEAFQGRLLANPPLKTSFDLPGNGPSCPQADTAKTRGINLQTGKALLEEIRKEKARLIKEGKLKKEKPLPEITEDEIPFDIPENWCWCRLGEIVYNNGQKTPDKEFSYIDIGSIDNLHQKLNDKENFVSPEQAPSRARKIVKKGDIIYATVRPYLHNMCIIDKDFEKEPIASTGFAVLACYPQINNQYLFYYLLSPSFDNYANDTENSKGVAYPAINDDRLYKGIVPLPPLAEQKRIVTAIEKMLALCEKLGE